MLVGSQVRRVAVVGGVRIPFARSMGAYAECSNQDLLVATLRAVTLAPTTTAPVLSATVPVSRASD